jgi:hypothetical protein
MQKINGNYARGWKVQNKQTYSGILKTLEFQIILYVKLHVKYEHSYSIDNNHAHGHARKFGNNS